MLEMGEEKGGGWSIDPAWLREIDRFQSDVDPAAPGYIVPTTDIGSSSYQGTLTGYTFDSITDILGFEPNMLDDSYKVDTGKSWAFRYVDVRSQEESYINIWSWKGSGLNNYDPSFSFCGSSDVMERIFGPRFVNAQGELSL
jgi:hypothetical protein